MTMECRLLEISPLTFRTFNKSYRTKQRNVLRRPVGPNNFLSENPTDPTVFRNSGSVTQIKQDLFMLFVKQYVPSNRKVKQGAVRATHCAPENNVPTLLTDHQGLRILFFDRLEKHKIISEYCALASCKVSSNSVQRSRGKVKKPQPFTGQRSHLGFPIGPKNT